MKFSDVGSPKDLKSFAEFCLWMDDGVMAPKREQSSSDFEFSEFPQVTRAQFVASLDRDLKKGVMDVKDNATFIRILDTAINHCGLDQNELAELFETSHTSVSRWINGKTLPHAQYRLPIVLKLRDKVEALSHSPVGRQAKHRG